MRSCVHHIILILILMLMGKNVIAQESIFTGLGKDIKRADRLYKNGSYPSALELYLDLQRNRRGEDDIALKIARTYVMLNNPEEASFWFKAYVAEDGELKGGDLLDFAECLAGTGAMDEAVRWYKKYRDKHKGDIEVMRKIWRMENIVYLYEDSIFFEVKPVAINSSETEFGAVYYNDGIVFLSNRSREGGIARIDEATQKPFLRWFYSEVIEDTITRTRNYGEVEEFGSVLEAKYHKGTVAFFPEGDIRMVYTKSSKTFSRDGRTTLQLHFARERNGKWEAYGSFPHNSTEYSVSHPAIAPDGRTMYFVSDRPGGFGGRDIYKSKVIKGIWSTPINLGPEVNTSGDESFPFVQGDNLYFASDGHGGFGGLDIYRFNLSFGEEPENMGYPVNTIKDDFGLVLNAEGTHGYLSSNRNGGPLNDDLFEVELDLQQYPLTISGVVKVRETEIRDDLLRTLPNADLFLVDHKRGITVYETRSDSLGNFSLEIPYSSQYMIRIVSRELGENIVSLEIPKNRKKYTSHEIVVVKKLFKLSNETNEEGTSQLTYDFEN